MSNPCKELGCTACCGEMCLTKPVIRPDGTTRVMPIDDATFQLLAAGAVVKEVKRSDFDAYTFIATSYVRECSLIEASIINPQDGSLFHLVQQTGECPQLREGECGIYNDRPFACRLFPADKQIGGDTCSQIREARHLPPFAKTGT